MYSAGFPILSDAIHSEAEVVDTDFGCLLDLEKEKCILRISRGSTQDLTQASVIYYSSDALVRSGKVRSYIWQIIKR